MWQAICEGAWGPMAFAAIILVGSLGWLRSSPKDKRAIFSIAISAAALIILPMINWLVVTDRESVAMAVKTMERQANARDFKSIVDGIDPEFRSHGGLDQKGLHVLLSTLEARHGVKMIQVKRPDVLSPNADGTFPCEFTMRLTGDFGEFVVLVKTTWKKRGGAWRVHRVVVTRLLDKDQTPLPV
jgi:hypothetical protein